MFKFLTVLQFSYQNNVILQNIRINLYSCRQFYIMFKSRRKHVTRDYWYCIHSFYLQNIAKELGNLSFQNIPWLKPFQIFLYYIYSVNLVLHFSFLHRLLILSQKNIKDACLFHHWIYRNCAKNIRLAKKCQITKNSLRFIISYGNNKPKYLLKHVPNVYYLYFLVDTVQ